MAGRKGDLVDIERIREALIQAYRKANGDLSDPRVQYMAAVFDDAENQLRKNGVKEEVRGGEKRDNDRTAEVGSERRV